MSEEDLRVLIRQLFLRGNSNVPIESDLNLVEAGICDSFALLEIAMSLEAKLDIRIPDSDVTVDNFGSIQCIQRYLTEHSG